ncbi:hypothetical protein [Streptomyces hundungensis]|uniref:hypothetical protein n=1 Tax=Streptomyces hundungensis TaxID=1077946 RepID=UPI0033D2E4D1
MLRARRARPFARFASRGTGLKPGHLVCWSVPHRHAHGRTAMPMASPSAPPAGRARRAPSTATYAGADAQRLLNHDALPTADRIAGLLLNLYAQKISTISQLAVDDVNITGKTVAITFGNCRSSSPCRWSPWSANSSLTDEAKPRSTHRILAPWLIPGGQPGRPLSDSQIGQRLHKIIIHPPRDRPTTLFPLASELPAAILAGMLGVHILLAVQWQKASGGDVSSLTAHLEMLIGHLPPSRERDQLPAWAETRQHLP